MNDLVVDFTAGVKKEKEKVKKVSLSLSIPADLYDKIRLDSLMSKKTLGTMVEEWIDQNVSLQDVSIGLAFLMKNIPDKEKVEPGVEMKCLTIPVSRRHHNMIRMEAMRKNSTIRALLKGWIQENTREWFVESGDQEAWHEKAA